MAEGSYCRDCKWWDNELEILGCGVCNFVYYSLSREAVKCLWLHHEQPAGERYRPNRTKDGFPHLYTDPNFGCAKWEKRDG